MNNRILRAAILLLMVLAVPTALSAQYRALQMAPNTPSFQLTVRADVPIFVLFIDGQNIKGNTATVPAGEHTVTVRAPGLPDWEQKVNVTGNMTITANLRRTVEHQLNVNSNIQGADVYINGTLQGQTGYSARLRPGTYEIRVSEEGYQDYSATITINQNQDIYANLQPLWARVQVRFPASLLNARDRGASGKVEIWVDGTRQNGHSFQLTAGQHEIEIVTGGFSIAQTFVFQPGRDYVIEPSLGLSIR